MKLTHFIWVANGALLLAGVVAWVWPQAERDALRGELVAIRAAAREVERLREDNRRLATGAAPEGEVERLRADHAALGRLRDELAGLKGRAETKAGEAAAKGAERAPRVAADPVAPAGAGPVVPAAEWKNAGRATPTAALETLMWTAAGGDIEAMVGAIKLDYNGRIAAKAALEQMPDALRATYGTPERLVALLTMPNVPLGAMQVIKVDVSVPANTQNTEMAVMQVRLKTAEGRWEEKGLVLFRNPTNAEGWRFSVMVSAVQEYLAMLKAPVAVPGSAKGAGGK